MARRWWGLLPEHWVRDLRGRRASAVVLSAALLVAIFVASLGVGYTATRPLNDTGGAVLAKGNTVAYVNGESGRVEAEARALVPGAATLETATLRDGRVAVVDHATDRVWVVDTTTMTPQGGPIDRGAGQAGAPKAGLSVVPGPQHSYLVDADAGTVEEIGPQGAPIVPTQVPGGATTTAVPDGSDGVWVLTTDRMVVHLRGGQVVRQVDSGGRIDHLTLADGVPIAITDSGELLRVAADPLRGIPGERVAHGPNVVVGSPNGAGRWILIVDRRVGELMAIDPRTGSRQVFSDLPEGPRHNLGAPVLAGDLAYIPDHATHTLYVRNVATGATLRDIDVPGKSATISLQVHGEKVWANDPNDRGAVVIGPDGNPLVVDKGNGKGLTDTNGADATAAPNPPPGPLSRPPAPPAPPPAVAPEPEPADERPPAPRQVRVPDIRPGTDKDEACRRIEDAELLCSAVATSSDGPTDEVIGTDPPGGTEVQPGHRVTVRHHGPTTVPDVVGRYATDACQTIATSRLRCASEPNPAPATSPDQLDLVSAQDPSAKAEVATGSIVTVRYWNQAVLGDYRNRPGAQACADIEAAYRRVECTVAEGGQTTAQTGLAAGTGYDQSPAPGSAITMGQTVTILVVKGSRQVPDVRGMGKDQACQTLAAHGYGCDARADAIARHKVVTSQDTAPGTPMDGGAVVIHYAPYEPVAFRLYRSDNGEPVFLVRMDGNPHERYGTLHGDILGYGYAQQWQQPGTVMIWDHYCTSNPDTCLGHSTNHYQSRDRNRFHDNWQGPQESARFIAEAGPESCAAGQVRVYRFADFKGRDRNYITLANRPERPANYPDYQEFLGCLWSP